MNRNSYINSINLNSGTDFPYLVLDIINDNSFPMNPGFQVMHWHEDLQFILVLIGSIEVCTLDTSVQIHAGESLFINRNVVHNVLRLENCHYKSILFPAYFLEFYAGSPAKNFVERITANELFSFIHFTSERNWHREITDQLRALTQMENTKTDSYIYEVLVRLSSIWLVMGKHVSPPQKQRKSVVHLRIQTILRYIETHYAEDITLADLCLCANISKSECARCFKVSMNTTPYKYLTEFRLAKAAQLLKDTDEPVGTIAAAVGFHQMSHFGKCFKEKTGYTPKAYRECREIEPYHSRSFCISER